MRADLVLANWWRTRRAMAMSAERLACHRQRQWQALQPALAATPALAGFAGRPLAEFPVTDVAQMRADYGRWNSLGLSDAQLRHMADAAEAGDVAGEVIAGWSTGSGGGTRGLFVADARERADYLGQSLARLLPPRALLKRQRIALLLRANSSLYAQVGGRRFAFRHVPLDRNVEQVRAELEAFAPTILIAPPHRLLALATEDLQLPALAHLFYGSEPMSGAEAELVTGALGLVPRAIWQATEGFLGAGCAHGRLHLNDHTLEIEAEEVPGTDGFRPVITDLRRRSQPVVRLRGDDFVEWDRRGDCRCGFAGRTVLPIAGRLQDLWHVPSGVVTPREVVAIVEGAIGAGHDWQATASPSGVHLVTSPSCPNAAEAARQLGERTGLPVALAQDFPGWPGPKRRKVVWTDG